MKSPLRASEENFPSMQTIPATVVSLRLHSENQFAESDDVWNIWPYSWAIAGHENATNRFHSFHKKLNSWKLERHNRRVLRQHRDALQGWNCEAGARIVK